MSLGKKLLLSFSVMVLLLLVISGGALIVVSGLNGDLERAAP